MSDTSFPRDLESRQAADQDALALRSEVRHCFPRGEVGTLLASQVLSAFDAAADDRVRETVAYEARLASEYARQCYARGGWFHDADLSEWFSLPALGFRELAARQARALEEWRSRLADADDDDSSHDVHDWGRTLPWDDACTRWMFVRFGDVPAGGRSRFGLAREDTEDGPDPWKFELGMTHEAGVCVFRCRRHPDVRGAVLLVEPHYSLARYDVPSMAGHLLSVIPDAEAEPKVFLLSGTPCRVRGRDGSWRTELGSDGEYMLDPGQPIHVKETGLDDVFVSMGTSVREFLLVRRGYTVRPPL